ncbi:GAF domain-containing protein [Actinosynnema sp. NPDC047251]|uniref:GAF sensor signal transduction histidine kinase n=1 Tax=Saccharothrix espanaensis (strain ATCC 51144 / DSM 44229 / JCM 9112 / NBRC 15066 / NRRL 15764) TaxID=1179773 RepID=K0KAI6_SACES|nr:GAF domain-containing protein [Saccharothrix espanaensis]CCH34537.1 GAF sensor signal transduction histidine kinase [Saccharothrix espanaensis DSM 44229]
MPGSPDPNARLDGLLRELTDRTAEVLGSQERMHRLLGAVVSLASDLSLPDVLRRIVESSCGLVGARYGALAVVGPNRQLLEFTYGDEPHRTEFDGMAFDPAAPGFLGVPVHVRGEVFGNLYLTDKENGADFTRADHEVVVAVAAAAGIAIENARLYEQSRQREVWLRASNEVTNALLTGTPDRDSLRLVAVRARLAADGVNAVLALPDAQGELAVRVMDGELRGFTVSREGSASREVYATGRTKVLDGLPGHFDRIGPVVIVPLAAGERILGVLMVARARDHRVFDASDVALVESFARQAALILEFTRATGAGRRLAVLEDRDRIARDLHDLVVQRLFGLGLGLQGLNGLVEQPLVVERLADFVSEVDQTIREIRRTIFSLQEPPAGSASLRVQLMRVVQDSSRLLGFEPALAADGPIDSLVPDHVRPDLLATLREALANAARHASARKVQVQVEVDRDATELRLVVTDDGDGLPTGRARHTGGLVNMAARAARWDGTCEVHSEVGKGVTVTWSVPLVSG